MQQPTIDALKQQIAEDINKSLARHGFHLIYTPPSHSEPPVPNAPKPHSDAGSDGSATCSGTVSEQPAAAPAGQPKQADEARFRSKLSALMRNR